MVRVLLRCDSVDKAIASGIGSPRFKSSHWQYFKQSMLSLFIVEKKKENKKMPGKANFKSCCDVIVHVLGQISQVQKLDCHVAKFIFVPSFVASILFFSISVTRFGDFLDFGQLFKAFGSD